MTSAAPNKHCDSANEMAMDAILSRMMTESDSNEKRSLWYEFAKLHALRSPALVKQMEMQKGLTR